MGWLSNWTRKAISEYGADASYSINSVDQLMPELLKGLRISISP